MARAISASSQRDALGVEHANVHDVGLPSRVSTDSLLFPLPFPAGELISLRLTEQGLPVGTWDQKLFQEVSEAHAKSFEQLRPAQPVDAVEQAHTPWSAEKAFAERSEVWFKLTYRRGTAEGLVDS